MTHRILVVEDDPNIMTSIEFLLSNAGYAVTTTDNGARAWETLQVDDYDLVVLDVMLPVFDGLELCKRIRTTARLQPTRILMLSARGRDAEIETGLRLGANAYMTKPFGTHEFLGSVARLLAL